MGNVVNLAESLTKPGMSAFLADHGTNDCKDAGILSYQLRGVCGHTIYHSI